MADDFDIQEYLAKGGYLLATGNAFEMFGNYMEIR